MSPESSTPAQNAKLAKLTGYPECVRQAYERFCMKRNPDDLQCVVFGALAFLLSTKPATPLDQLPDTSLLQQDIGADSLAITELVFLLEELFDISIKNEEIMAIRTLGDLRAFVLAKVPLQSMA
ncbi:MAG: acyl carrier protein [Verrucomicrobiota bacterium]|nr:acyl carrier protein [Verrucomicrobiota bacterium]